MLETLRALSRLGRIKEIGRIVLVEHLINLADRIESERLLLNREEFNHFIAYDAACTEDGDHVKPALAKEEGWASCSFRSRLY